jgi:hypothetical protein
MVIEGQNVRVSQRMREQAEKRDAYMPSHDGHALGAKTDRQGRRVVDESQSYRLPQA